MDVPGGDRIATLMDPHGAFFALHVRAGAQAAAPKAGAKVGETCGCESEASPTRKATEKKQPAKKAAAKKKPAARKVAKPKPKAKAKKASPRKAPKKAKPKTKSKAKPRKR